MFYSLWVQIKERLYSHNPTECSHLKSIRKTSVRKHVCGQQLTFHCAPAAHPFGPFSPLCRLPIVRRASARSSLNSGSRNTIVLRFISVQNILLCIHFHGDFFSLLNLHICAHLCHPLLLVPGPCRRFNSTQWVAHLSARFWNPRSKGDGILENAYICKPEVCQR